MIIFFIYNMQCATPSGPAHKIPRKFGARIVVMYNQRCIARASSHRGYGKAQRINIVCCYRDNKV